MYLVTCFKKLFSSPMFWATVIGTAAICMFSELYFDPQTSTSETVISMYAKYAREAMLSDSSLCSYGAFTAGFGNWAAMFAPVLAALASIGICTDERKSGMWRFALSRVGRVRYGISGCLFILISGGLALMLGYGLFGILTTIMFPPLSAYPPESAEMFRELIFRPGSPISGLFAAGGLPLCVTAELLETFFFGMVCSAAAMLLFSICENKYVIICTPFFLKYSLSQIASVTSFKAIEDPMNFNEKLLNFSELIQPDGAKSFLSYSENALSVAILNAAFLAISAVIFCVIRIRRLRNET